jgi:menaquinone-dependent protoporphyrinogen IX oxidase
MGIKYPNVHVVLAGRDGNVYSIIANVAKALKGQVGQEAADEFKAEAMAMKSYDDVLALCQRTVNVT